MGVIQRQGIKTATVGYIGTAIGAVSTLWIYPLDTETYGLIQFVIGLATFLMPFASLGIIHLTVRFFPAFRNEKNRHNGFLGLLLWLAAGSIFFFIALAYFFQDSLLYLLGILNFDTQLFESNYPVVLLVAALLVLIQIFSGHSSNFKRIVVPSIFKNLYPKIAFAILVLLSFWGLIDDTGVKAGLVILHLMILISLVIYLTRLKQLHLKTNVPFLSTSLLTQMGQYALYGILGGLGGIIAFRLDSIMVASMIDLQSNGIYNIALFISNVIAIPLSAAENISAPIISAAWKDNNRDELESLYSKSSYLLLITGLFLFLTLWLALEPIFRLTPSYEVLIQGKNVFLFLGLAQLVNMATGINNQIITHSPLYRYNLLLIGMLAVLNVGANFWLIPLYGITGAAMASALSISVYNLLKFIFIWWKFGLQPLRRSFFAVVGLALLTLGVSLWLPKTSLPLLNIGLSSFLVLLFFIAPILFFRLAPELNALIFQFWQKLFPNKKN